MSASAAMIDASVNECNTFFQESPSAHPIPINPNAHGSDPANV